MTKAGTNVRLDNGADGWISASLIEIDELPAAESETITISGETRVVVEAGRGRC